MHRLFAAVRNDVNLICIINSDRKFAVSIETKFLAINRDINGQFSIPEGEIT